MNKKRLVLYGLLLSLVIGSLIGLYIHHEYLGEDPTLNPDALANPIVNETLRAIVTKKTVRKTGSGQKLVLDYTDLDSHKSASLSINDFYSQTVQPGDTLTKYKGEKIVLVYQKNGQIETIPID